MYRFDSGIYIPVERRLIRTVVEHLQELAPTQMEHELRVNAEVIPQPEACRILLPIIRKLLAQPNQHSIEPPQHIRAVVDLSLEHRDPGHEHRSRLLVERTRNVRGARLGEVPGDSGHTEPHLPRGMLVVCHELNEPAAAGCHGRPRRCNDLEVDCERRTRGERVDLPCARLPYSDLGFADTPALLACGDSMCDEAGDLELLGGLYVEGGVEAHLEVAPLVLGEGAQEGLLEDRRCERVGENNDTVRAVRQRLHLEQTGLVQASCEEVDHVTIVRNTFRQALVKLQSVS
jgi:hypothetical protein